MLDSICQSCCYGSWHVTIHMEQGVYDHGTVAAVMHVLSRTHYTDAKSQVIYVYFFSMMGVCSCLAMSCQDDLVIINKMQATF